MQAMAYEHEGAVIETDEEGYLADPGLWSPELAVLIADGENIEMSDDHWEIVKFLRNFYQKYQIAPAIRILTREIRKTLGPEKGNSRYLYGLFPDGPVKQASKIAGLPKPTSCI
jgi:tRNA 2-thiouridine synthesizing protein E